MQITSRCESAIEASVAVAAVLDSATVLGSYNSTSATRSCCQSSTRHRRPHDTKRHQDPPGSARPKRSFDDKLLTSALLTGCPQRLTWAFVVSEGDLNATVDQNRPVRVLYEEPVHRNGSTEVGRRMVGGSSTQARSTCSIRGMTARGIDPILLRGQVYVHATSRFSLGHLLAVHVCGCALGGHGA